MTDPTAQVILKDVSSQAALSPGVQAAGTKDADALHGQVLADTE